jgi:hypothetical protein
MVVKPTPNVEIRTTGASAFAAAFCAGVAIVGRIRRAADDPMQVRDMLNRHERKWYLFAPRQVSPS